MIIMLGNQVELWELMLAGIKLGIVMIPTTTLMGAARPADRVERGGAGWVAVGSANIGKFADVPGDYTLIEIDDGGDAGTETTVPPSTRTSVPDAAGAPADFSARRAHSRRRDAAALLHLRHHFHGQTRGAHPYVLPRGPPVHHVSGSAWNPATST